MAKGWKSIGNNALSIRPSTIEEKETRKRDIIRKERNFAKAIRNTPSLKAAEIEERGERRFFKRQVEEVDLLIAFEEKKLKSKTAIKRAINIKKRRAEAEKKEKEAALKGEKAPVEAV